MIDFEKLKMAHKLAANSEEYYFEGVFGVNGDPDYLVLNTDGECLGTFDNEDSLIEKLQELTKPEPEPKYKVGDAVWYLDLPVNKIHCARVTKIRFGEYVIDGGVNGTKDDFIESELYHTKSALIEAQIKYWLDMREEKPQERQYHHPRQYADALVSGLCARQVGTTGCQHESDGYIYTTPLQPQMHSKKCIKCEEFYV